MRVAAGAVEDAGTAAEGEGAAIEALNAADRGCPFMPALDVGHDLPDAVRRRADLNCLFQMHAQSFQMPVPGWNRAGWDASAGCYTRQSWSRIETTARRLRGKPGDGATMMRLST